MRKLISLFLVLVMSLMLAPTALAVRKIDIKVYGTTDFSSGTTFTYSEIQIYNSGSSPTSIYVTTGSQKIEFELMPGPELQDLLFDMATPSSSAIIKVKPKKELKAGSYTDYLIFKSTDTDISSDTTYSGVSEFIVTYKFVLKPAPAIGLFDHDFGGLAIPGDYSFGRQYVGYTSPGSLTFYIRNTGNNDLSVDSNLATLTDASCFDISIPATATTYGLDWGDSIAVTVSPKTSLPVGNYSSTLTVNVASATSQSFKMHFTVDSWSAPPPATNNYSNRTLTDPATGVSVSGRSIHNSAVLSVAQNGLHAAGKCSACDTIRSYMSNGQVLSVHNISMTRGHTGTLDVSIPVSSGYNGNRLTIAHCNNGVFESQDAYASNGMVTGAFSSLSPFAVISGISDNSTGNDVIWPPKTGDPTSYKDLGVIFILLSATAGSIIMRYKRKAKR